MEMRLPKRRHLIVVLVMVICLVFLFFKNRIWPTAVLTVNNRNLQVFIADTYARQFEGWSNKSDMQGKDGMLFVFGMPGKHVMVMRDMRFALDMIWLNGNRVVAATEGVKPEPGVPEDRLKKYSADEPDTAILELKAGLIEELGIKVGDTVIVSDY